MIHEKVVLQKQKQIYEWKKKHHTELWTKRKNKTFELILFYSIINILSLSKYLFEKR